LSINNKLLTIFGSVKYNEYLSRFYNLVPRVVVGGKHLPPKSR
jgi:hypothetical protein